MTMDTARRKNLPARMRFGNALGSAIMVAVAVFVLDGAQWSLAQPSQAKTFASAAEASHALYEAVQQNDEQAVEAILGGGSELASSGDKAQDKLDREQFVEKYQQMRRLERDADGFTTLYIGAENWPFPVPLKEENGKWHFDSSGGLQEVLARRVGEDEMIGIRVCQDVARANRKELTSASADPIADYARRLVASRSTNDRALPDNGLFYGYQFRWAESGGAMLIAYPAKYRATGVMTFTVTSDGSLREKDLGSQTSTLAPQITGNQNGAWSPVQ